LDEVIVRGARPSDLGRLLALYAELAGEKASAAPAGIDRSRPVLELILAQPSRHLLVAELGGALAGTVDMLIVSNLTHGAMPWAIVENVVVAERHRGRGIGRRLFERAFELAREADCCKVQLISGRQRTGAHAFYRSLGMEAVAEGFKLYLDS